MPENKIKRCLLSIWVISFVIFFLFVSFSFVSAGELNQLKVTNEHPFYVNGKWIKAVDLKVGDELLSENGRKIIIRSIRDINLRDNGENVEVYNLHVDNVNNYFANGVLVHNKAATRLPDLPKRPTTYRGTGFLDVTPLNTDPLNQVKTLSVPDNMLLPILTKKTSAQTPILTGFEVGFLEDGTMFSLKNNKIIDMTHGVDFAFVRGGEVIFQPIAENTVQISTAGMTQGRPIYAFGRLAANEGGKSPQGILIDPWDDYARGLSHGELDELADQISKLWNIYARDNGGPYIGRANVIVLPKTPQY